MSQASPIKRRKSRQIMVGTVPVCGDAPISVQSMTNTETRDVDATLAQINAIAEAGADIVRVSVPSMDAAEAFKLIRQQSPVPLVADIHFDHKIALKVAEYGVDCLRINPGNIGKEQKVREVIAACKDKGIPIRIGVNAGSLGKELMRKYPEPTSEALIESALKNVDILDRHNFPDFKVSVKASEVFMAVAAYRGLAQQIDQPLHLGITEAGALRGGTVKSAVGLGMLLMEGIGDTIRVSLAADPVEEVKVGFEILKSLKLRTNGINFIACPSCMGSGNCVGIPSVNSVLNSSTTLWVCDIHEPFINASADLKRLNLVITLVFVVIGLAMVPVYATADSIINLVQELYGLLSMPILSAFIVGLLFRDVAAGAAIIAVVLGVLLYGFFSFVWAPLHYIHMMFFTVIFCVLSALTVSRLIFGTRPAFDPVIRLN